MKIADRLKAGHEWVHEQPHSNPNAYQSELSIVFIRFHLIRFQLTAVRVTTMTALSEEVVSCERSVEYLQAVIDGGIGF